MSSELKLKHKRAKRRATRVRSRIAGTAEKPRLSVYRSSKHLYAQVINDEKGVTIIAVSTMKMPKGSLTKTKKAEEIGAELGKVLLKKKVTQVVFDRGRYKYTGRVRQLAEAVRSIGITI